MLKQIRKELSTAIGDAERSITDGSPQDFAAYRFEVGLLEGLRRALAIVRQAESRRDLDDAAQGD